MTSPRSTPGRHWPLIGRSRPAGLAGPSPVPRLIGAGIDGTASGRDAAALGALLAREMDAELLLIAVHEEPVMQGLLPREVSWSTLDKQAWATVAQARDEQVPNARIVVQSDALIWRGLRHAVRLEHRDLLVVGSAGDLDAGRTGLGRSARELLGHLECPLAIAPVGIREAGSLALTRIGVGFDGSPESEAALAVARSIASAAGAALEVRGVIEERVLRELCDSLDLLVIGSSRIGRPGRVELGDSGSSVVDLATCPVLVVPRPTR
jgi:nucleotide-binding universal stress UspA family protein